MGPPAVGAPVGRALRRGEGRHRLPDRLGAHPGGNRCTPGDPEGVHASAPQERAVPARVRPGQPHGGRRAGRLLLQPLEPPGRHAHPDDAPRRVAGEDSRRCGARLLLRRVVAAGVHRARVRRVPDRPVARRARCRRQGPRVDRGRMEPGRVPRGHQVTGRSRAAVPPRDVAPVPGARDRRRADRRSSARIRPCPRDGSGRRPGVPPSRSGTAHRCIRRRAKRIRTSLAGWRRRSLDSSTRTDRPGGSRCGEPSATRRRRSPDRRAPAG